MSTIDLVIPNPNSENDKSAFNALIQAMVSMNKVLICRYTPRKNSELKLTALLPCK